MSALLTPAEAVAALRDKVSRRWAHAVCAELGIGEPVVFSVRLRPGVTSSKAVDQVGRAAWVDWRLSWRKFQPPQGVQVIAGKAPVDGADQPATLTADLDGALALLDPQPVDVDRARALASSMVTAGAILTPATLRATYDLRQADAQVLLTAVAWLREHPDASRWTLRQLPIPGMHTKWITAHGALLRDAAGRDVRTEVRRRPTVVHLTYVDAGHTAASRRRHDAWTTGDLHDIAYQPRVVLVVENRDSRLWFPPVDGTVVVEGGGKAAAARLATVPWIRAAEHVVYWGDMDADGYLILDQFRAALAKPAGDAPLRQVASLLMDVGDLHRYAEHGVNHDRAGRPIAPSSLVLPHLTAAETTAYDTIATAGPTPFRRIEQEAIPLEHAAARLRLVSGVGSEISKTTRGGSAQTAGMTSPGVWPCLQYDDAEAARVFLTEVFGFTETLTVRGADGRQIVHAELTWPEGGGVMYGDAEGPSDVPKPTGIQWLCVRTADPDAVFRRAREAGATVVQEPYDTDYDAHSVGIADPQGHVWTFTTYGGA